MGPGHRLIRKEFTGPRSHKAEKHCCNRHKVAGYRTVCKHVWLQGTDRYYEHIPEKFINVNGTTVMEDIPVITERTVLANRTDTVLRDERERTCLLNGIAAPNDSNINTEETE